MKIKGVHAAPALVIIISALICAANYLDISKISGSVNPYLTVMALEIGCIGLPCVFFCLLRGTEYRERLNLRLMKVGHVTLSVYALILLIASGIALSLVTYRFFPEAFAASATSGLRHSVEETGMTDTLYAALAFGVLPAFLEEFLFRGVVIAEYSPYGGATAVIFSSLMFGLMHFTPVRLPIYFVTGVVLAITLCATGSLLTTSLIHASYNVFTIYFEKYIYKVAAKQSGGLILLTFIVVTVLLVFAMLFFGRVERLYRQKSESNVPSPMRIKRHPGDTPPMLSALLSPTFLIFVIFAITVSFFF